MGDEARFGRQENGGFDPNTILATIGKGTKILSVAKKRMIFTERMLSFMSRKAK
jgi:hypothetical protein